MLAHHASNESSMPHTEGKDKSRRSSLIPTSSSAGGSSARKQTTKKLSKAQPSGKPAASGTSVTASADARCIRHHAASGGVPLGPPSNVRTPSLVSGSSVASTFESPRSNVLRRKPSTIAKYVADRSEASTTYYEPTADDSVLGISMPAIHTSSTYLDRTAPIMYQSDRLHWNTSQPMSLSSLGISNADTPSTRFTGSPFSHNEAPSSRSSVSPLGFPPTRQYASKDIQKGHQQPTAPAQSQASTAKKPSQPKQVQEPSRNRQTRPTGPLLASPELTVHSGKRLSQQAKPIKAASLQAPPELAHLSDSAKAKQADAAPTQMSRFQQSQLPQRNSSLLDTQSESSNPPQHHIRTGSRGSISSTTSQTFRSRFGLTSRASSKLSLQSDDESHGTSAAVHSGQSKMRIAQSSSDVEPAAPAKQVAQKTSRFGFLSRKSKQETAQPVEKPKREPRKGPAAGTGHERYGKFGFRGRSSSNTSTSDNRSPSTGSQKSSFSDRFAKRKDSTGTQAIDDMDDFLRERLKPKVLRGSGSNFSAFTSPSVFSVNDDKEDTNHDGLSRVSTSQSSRCETPAVTSGPSGVSPQLRDAASSSVTSLSGHASSQPYRISVYSTSSMRPKHHDGPSALDVMRSDKNASTTSLKRQDAEEGAWMRPLEPAKKPSSRWNFLQRVRSSPLKSKSSKPAPFSEHSPDNKQSRFDNAAHYALLDAVEPVTLEEVEQLVASPSKSSANASGASSARSSMWSSTHDTRHDTLLPSPPNFGNLITRQLAPVACAISPVVSKAAPPPDKQATTASSSNATLALPTEELSVKQQEPIKSALHTPDLSASKESPRLPRLSPVGRIPRVKSGRDRDRQLPTTSFSRPFASTQSRPTVKPPGTLYSQIRDVASPTPDTQESLAMALSPADSVLNDQKISDAFSNSSNAPASRTSTSYPGFSMFAFPSRKNSVFSYSSSSESASYMAFAYNNAFEQEDVWHEYNDLLDEVSVDYSQKLSRRSSTQCSSQSAVVNTTLPHFTDHAILISKNPASPPPEQALPVIPRNQSIRTVSSSNDRAATPSKQKQQGNDSVDSSQDSHLSSQSPEDNIRSSHTSFSSGADCVRRSRISMISMEEQRRSGVHPAVNVNFDALMTSKWLSFGRVLFSPAHNETRLADDPRILILDGLSDEWSYFVALTYPQATVYNLELTSRPNARKNQSQSLSNHRKIFHAAVGAPLPFPKGFFTAAVFRFPVATTDQAYHTAIAEFKRVLRPGGHLEISILDIDLRAMGNLARKAVRGLKTRMQQQQESISLRSLSDFMVQSVGKRGFEEIQRCIVGVPVISRAVKDGETRAYPMLGGSNSTSLSAIKDRNDMIRQQTADALTGLGPVAEVEETDDKMTRTVARVGRWWYSMCYERVVPKHDQSIWKDGDLLQECYDNGTSFQMLMCHAQKPVQLRRHTRSV